MKRRKFRQILAILLSAVMLCGMFVGCGEQSYQPTGELYINTLNVAALSSSYQSYCGKYGKEFSLQTEGDKNQWYRFRRKLNYENLDKAVVSEELQTYYDNLQTGIMKSQASDIVEMDNFYWDYDVQPLDYIKMAKAGAFVELYDLSEQVGYALSGWNKTLLDSVAIDGKLYFMPTDTYMLVFSTTAQVLEENDFPYNSNDTAIEFLRKCVAWKEEHPDGPEVFCSEYWTCLYQYWYEITGYDIVDYTAQRVSFDTDSVRELLELIKELKPLEYDPDIYDMNQNTVYRRDSYYNRSCLFADYWTEDNTALEEGDHLVLMPLRREDGGTMLYTNSAYMIPTTANNVYNAGKYLLYYMDNSAHSVVNKTGGNFFGSTLQPELDQKLIADTAVHQVDLNYYTNVLTDWYAHLDRVLMPQSWMYTMRSYFEDYYADKISVDELTRVLQEKMEIYITE